MNRLVTAEEIFILMPPMISGTRISRNQPEAESVVVFLLTSLPVFVLQRWFGVCFHWASEGKVDTRFHSPISRSFWAAGPADRGSRGRLEVKVGLEGMLEAYEAQWSTPVRLEVMVGERRLLGRYFSVIPYRRCEEADWERAIGLAWRLRDEGVSIPWVNVLVAAVTLHDGSRLYALNAHFAEVARLTGLRLYKPGYGGSFVADQAGG